MTFPCEMVPSAYWRYSTKRKAQSMRPKQFDEANIQLQPAQGDEESVQTLPALKDGGTFVSCWQLEEGDLELLQQTGEVWLLVSAEQHPPVRVSAVPLLVRNPERG